MIQVVHQPDNLGSVVLAENVGQRSHRVLGFFHNLQKTEQCALGIFLECLFQRAGAQAQTLEPCLGGLGQFAGCAEIHQHGIGGRRGLFHANFCIQKGRAKGRNFLAGHAVGFGRAAGPVSKIDYGRCLGVHGIGQGVHGIAKQAHAVLGKLEIIAQAGHGGPGLGCRNIEGHAHLGGVFGKGQQLLLGNAGLTGGCRNGRKAIGRHRQAGGQLQHIRAELFKTRRVKVGDFLDIGHGRFKVDGQLDRHGHGRSRRKSASHLGDDFAPQIPLALYGLHPLQLCARGFDASGHFLLAAGDFLDALAIDTGFFGCFLIRQIQLFQFLAQGIVNAAGCAHLLTGARGGIIPFLSGSQGIRQLP